ncbi:RnfABCDGE type electron transport complex subunit B [Methylohalobius crimeensis]|uniref:RnfABCDGE type electron transport complex subunit B n=1 Tax=Methylohalobius crimeensis TaxID=244365 RepID=UPI0003B53824|nr:RnfABCDGE type electron transport complex subunit B [Methylohalobius crimeensis]
MSALIALSILGGLTLVLATLLVLANKKLHVEEDPRIDRVEAMLPHVNCGACGYPGCRSFAEALVRGEASPAQCSVGTDEDHARIAAFLGVAVGEREKRVARLACAGGSNVARRQARYAGIETCQAATQVSGGGKSCFWSCLGYGDCEAACQFDAIQMNEHDLPVVSEDKCTACGDCVEVCPKDLFSLHPISHRLWVPCKNEEAGDHILEYCQVACTACRRCAMDAPDELITMRNNLPMVDYSKPHQTRVPIQRCPTGAIVWLEPDGTALKGRAAPKIIRREPLKEAAT